MITDQSPLVLFFALLIGHAVGDYVLQNQYVATSKCRHSDQGANGIWLYSLTAHALVHAGIVWLITHDPILAAVELVLHWVIDFAKCEGKINYHIDQSLHVVCKVCYVAIII